MPGLEASARQLVDLTALVVERRCGNTAADPQIGRVREGGVFGRWWCAAPQQGHRQGWRKRERGEGEGACEKLRRQEDEQILLEEEETQESYDFDPTVDILSPEKK